MSDWKLLQGDCLELMPEIPPGSIDAVVTDPPWPDCKEDFGWLGDEWWSRVVADLERVVGDKGKVIIHLNSETNPVPFLAPFKLPFIHVCALRFIPPRYRGNICNELDFAYCLGYGFLPRGKKVLGQLCNNAPSRGKRSDMLKFPAYRNLGHVTWLIKSQVGPGDIVLDPCVGSGTTAFACRKLDRKFICIDILPKLCNQIAKEMNS